MILEAKDLTFRYPCRRAAPVLKGVSLVLRTGERLGMSAPSGRGKTTLCKLLAGWEEPGRGQVMLDGGPLPRRGLCPVQLLWQHPEEAVDPLLKLRATLYEAGQPDPGVLEGLGVRESWLERYPSELSGGELQRICVARAMRPGVRFLLCDEISAMLDLVTQARMWRFLLEQAEQREMGLLIVSHDCALLERLCTRILDWEEVEGLGETRKARQ